MLQANTYYQNTSAPSFKGFNSFFSPPPENFRTIISRKLYAGASLKDEQEVTYLKNKGIKTLIYIDYDNDDKEEYFLFSPIELLNKQERLAKIKGMDFHSIKVNHEMKPQQAESFIRLMEDENIKKPVYLYCWVGEVRTPQVLTYYYDYLKKNSQVQGFNKNLIKPEIQRF